MSLRLPKFEDTSCRLITVCGQLVTGDKILSNWLGRQETLRGRYRAAGRGGYIHVTFGGRRPGNHIHMDVATREFFGRSAPKPKNKISEIQEVVKRIEGQRIDVVIRGLYLVSKMDLPEVFLSTIVETQVGDVSLKTIGGKLAVGGAPIHELTWSIPEGVGDARITLGARTSKRIDDRYLVDCCALLDTAFKAIILGGKDVPS